MNLKVLSVILFATNLYKPVTFASQSAVVNRTNKSIPIEGHTWRIAKYLDPTAKSKDQNGLTDAKSRATIAFVNGRVEGGPGCGGWLGTYKLSGAKLTVDAGSVLAGLCGTPSMFQGYLVVKAFQGILNIEQMDNEHILLRDEKGQARIELVPF